MPALLLFGYYDPEAPRTWTLMRQYESEGWTMIACRTDRKGFMRKSIDLIRQYRAMQRDAEAALVMFPGQYLMPLAWLLSHLRAPRFGGQARDPRKTLILDAFISQFDTLVSDRGLISRWNPRAWLLWLIDFVACHLADEVLVDTQAHKAYFANMFHLRSEKLTVRYLDARTDLFYPDPSQKKTAGPMHVFFYGSFIPLQGIEHILDAAKILQSTAPDVRITLLGAGQTLPAMRARAKNLQLANVEFQPAVGLRELPDRIRSADLCLGIFGTGAKTERVIPHKVYDAVACGIPVLTADTPAIRERFTDHPLVILCRGGDPGDIAMKIAACARNHKQ